MPNNRVSKSFLPLQARRLVLVSQYSRQHVVITKMVCYIAFVSLFVLCQTSFAMEPCEEVSSEWRPVLADALLSLNIGHNYDSSALRLGFGLPFPEHSYGCGGYDGLHLAVEKAFGRSKDTMKSWRSLRTNRLIFGYKHERDFVTYAAHLFHEVTDYRSEQSDDRYFGFGIDVGALFHNTGLYLAKKTSSSGGQNIRLTWQIGIGL